MTPLPDAQPAGVHHRRLGEVVATALNDGWVQLPAALYINCDAAEGARLSREAFGPAEPITSINAMLVRGTGRTVLIDAGGGAVMGSPTANRLPAAMQAAGVGPEEVDMVLLTHMHVDHLGGAITAEGVAAFPRAELVYPAAEAAYWLDPGRLEAAPEAAKPRFVLARRVADAYAGRARALEDGGLPAGIEPHPLPGHTPGHTGYLVGTGAERVLYWGDICHVPALQIRRPEIGVLFDSDPAQAASTRRAVLERVASERMLVNGGHMDFPGFAHVERRGDGFALVWSAWAPTL